MCSMLAVIFATTFGQVQMDAEIGSISEISSLSDRVERVIAFNAANTNVWFEATNYYETVGVPCSLQLYEIRDGETEMVWDQRKWEYYCISNEIAAVTNRNAWSAYQSGTGAANPLTDTTWVSTPKVALAGGLEWQKTVVASNEVFVLVDNGMVADLNSTNGCFFAIRDLEDNDIFSITKTDSVTLGASASELAVTNGDLYVHYNVVSDTHPTASVAVTLADGAIYFYDDGETGCPATIEWSGASGDWCAKISPTITTQQLFAKAIYTKEGSTVIKSNAPMQTTILTEDGVKIKPVVSGTTVTWEVVQ